MVNWIGVRSLLDISSIHEFKSRSIDFVFDFPQDKLDADVFMNIPLVMGVDGNIGEWVLKLNKPIYGL